MSELKRPCVLQLRHNNSEGFVYAYEVGEMNKYLSEVDKVLAAIRHQKYKRCLAMAKWCDTKADWYYGIGRSLRDRVEFYIKWHKRWLKIADEFKEAK